ncbi:MAG: N-acetyltransferase [Aliidongia sp.]|jgi:predicted N-acetyltransferase YhbS
MFKITTERPEHIEAIESLLDASFGVDRQNKISYCYRVGVNKVVPLCMIASADDQLVATIRYWPVAIGSTSSLLLGPVAVADKHRNAGLGGKLIRHSLGRAAALGYRSAVLVGDHAYYNRFGFQPASSHGIVMPDENPTRVLALSLQANRYALPSGSIGPWRPIRANAAVAA